MKIKSCEVKFYAFYLIVLSVPLILLGLVFVLLHFEHTRADMERFLIIAGVASLIIFPIFIRYICLLLHYQKLKPLYLQEAMLKDVETAKLRKWVRFSIPMNIAGVEKEIYTRSIFNITRLGPNNINDYLLKNAVVGYDEKYNIAVIIETIN